MGPVLCRYSRYSCHLRHWHPIGVLVHILDAQLGGYKPPMWETWIEFLAPVNVGTRGMDQ